MRQSRDLRQWPNLKPILFEAYFQEYETLLVDGTEQRKQRPGNKEMQKDYYSGKKIHAVKEIVISTTIR